MATRGEPAPDGLVTLPQVAEALDLSARSAQRRVKVLGLRPVERRGGIDYYAKDTIERIAKVSHASMERQDEAIVALVHTMSQAYTEAQSSNYHLIAELRRRAEAAEEERDRLRSLIPSESANTPVNLVQYATNKVKHRVPFSPVERLSLATEVYRIHDEYHNVLSSIESADPLPGELELQVAIFNSSVKFGTLLMNWIRLLRQNT